MNTMLILALTAMLAALATLPLEAADELDPARIADIAGMLPAEPAGLGRPIGDREAWERLGALEAFQAQVRRAEELLSAPIPEQPDELFLEFKSTGNRTNWQRVSGQRRGRLTPLVLAECVENQGRFIPAICEIVDVLCAERTWVMPAHDGNLTNFNGESIDIDLASSALAWNLATADYLLGQSLPAETRETLREGVDRFVLTPYRDMITGARGVNWWLKTTNNWNAVCLAGVTGAALCQLADRDERAQIVAAAEVYSANFLKGFTPDGYCSEGLGYWNYGFGHYVLLAETVRQATSGGVDLLSLPAAKAPARFGADIQIIGGVSPAFADCGVNAGPAADTMYFVNRYLGLGLPQYNEMEPGSAGGSLFDKMLFSFPNGASEREPVSATEAGAPIRTWFADAGILIGRPQRDSACRLGVALKGGHNAEHHNHNDVGSYVVVVENRPVLLDPGAEVYTARTFSDKRYESKLLNSYGHPVPVVGGQLQRTGRDRRAEVLAADFTDTTDILRLDLSAAYEVEGLKRLEREFVYSRRGEGSLTVTDRVAFDTPQSFETAILTKGDWQRLQDGSLVVYDVDQAVQVSIAVEGGPFSIVADKIEEEAAVHPIRLGIKLDEPVAAATVTLSMAPTDLAAGEAGLLRNGGFEYGSFGWLLPHNAMGEISDEMAATGRCSLKIADDSDKLGSNITSARVPVRGAAGYVLRGKARHITGEGIGMYVRYLDAEGRSLNPTDGRGNIPPVGSLAAGDGDWQDFEFPFETPASTTALQLWIHSYNAAQVEAYIDDLVLEKTQE